MAVIEKEWKLYFMRWDLVVCPDMDYPFWIKKGCILVNPLQPTFEIFYHLKANQKVQEFQYTVFKNPGHTLDSISFYFPTENVMFVGDFIFYHTIGRTDLGGSDVLMQESIRKILQEIPLNTTLYPGHGKFTVLEKEKPFLEQFL